MSHQAVTDPVPHNNNRLGYWLGMIFHPFTVFIPALIVVLKDTEPLAAVGWVVFMAVIILVPALTLIRLARRRGRYTYQRGMRHPLYGMFWASMVLCVGLAKLLDAPGRLVFSLLALVVWVPLQAVINARLTKISAHTAVVTGILTALFLMGDLDSPLLVIGAVGIVCATAWARVVTGHHSVLQVCLGIVASTAAVAAAFALMALF
jgi:phosphotransferase system  glucose/maltose/N-acetylglucosamine-specific IIC component